MDNRTFYGGSLEETFTSPDPVLGSRVRRGAGGFTGGRPPSAAYSLRPPSTEVEEANVYQPGTLHYRAFDDGSRGAGLDPLPPDGQVPAGGRVPAEDYGRVPVLHARERSGQLLPDGQAPAEDYGQVPASHAGGAIGRPLPDDPVPAEDYGQAQAMNAGEAVDRGPGVASVARAVESPSPSLRGRLRAAVSDDGVVPETFEEELGVPDPGEDGIEAALSHSYHPLYDDSGGF